MARPLKLPVDVDGAAKAAAELGTVGHAVNDIDDEAAKAERRLEALGREIVETAAKSKLLAAAFRDTGDTKFFQEFTRNERAIGGLRRLQKALRDTDTEASRLTMTLGGGKAGGGVESLLGGGFSASRLLLANPTATATAAGAAAPLAGGLGAAALLGGVGVAGIAAGVALSASDSKRVRDAFSGLAAQVAEDLKADAKSFEAPLLEVAQRWAAAFDRSRPAIQSVFRDLSKAVVPLADGLAGFAEEALPGIAKAARASVPFLRSMSRDLREIGRSTGDLFELVSHGGEGAADSFHALARAIEVTEEALGVVIVHSTSLVSLWADINEKTPLTGMLGLVDAIMGVDDAAEDLGETAPKTFQEINDSINSTLDVMRQLSDEFAKTLGGALGAAQANLNFQVSLDDLGESLDKNGDSFDTNTKKGQENYGALLDVVRAAEDVREAEIAAGVPIETANAKFNAQIDALRGVLSAAGLSKAEIDKLLAALLGYNKLQIAPKTLRINLSASALTQAMLTGRNPQLRGPAIATYDTGGTVPGRRGAPQLAIVHGGEKITPPGARSGTASSSGGSGGIRYSGSVGGLDSLFLSWLQQKVRHGEIVFD